MSLYTEPDIAGKQRVLVDQQLAAMREGCSPPHFASLGKLLQWLYDVLGDPSCLTLLDAACATAYYADIIQHYVGDWIEYYGIDFNPGMVTMAQNLYPGLPIVQGDVCDMDMFNDQAFDIVLSGATIMHIDDWHSAVRELARVSRQWLILHRTWILPDTDTPTQVDKRDAYGHLVSYITFNERELITLIQECGFEIQRTVPSGETSLHHGNVTYLFERKQIKRD